MLFKNIHFECGSGWFSIINETSKKLIVLQKVAKIRIETTQLKEKFSSARWYYSETHLPSKDKKRQQIFSDIISDVIHKAEAETEHTCEECGKYGTVNESGWLKCLCDDCRKKEEQERAERLKKK